MRRKGWISGIFSLQRFRSCTIKEKRVVEEHGVNPAEAAKHVLDRDKKRAKYYRHITDQVWGLAENYDLCLNSSKLGIDGCVEIILNCMK